MPKFTQELEHRALRRARHANGGSDGVALAEGRHDLRAALEIHLIHGEVRMPARAWIGNRQIDSHRIALNSTPRYQDAPA